MKNRIDLRKGKLGGDFSNGFGFYLTSDLEVARVWSHKMMRKETSAVIVFDTKGNNNLFQEDKGLTFLAANDQWENIVKYYRNRVNEVKKTRQLMALEHQRKYIYGPMSMDGSSAKSANWRPRPRFRDYCHGLENKDSKSIVMQLCIKDDFLALDFFEGSDIFVIFFKDICHMN